MSDAIGERVDYPRAAVADLVFRWDPEDLVLHILLLKKKPPRYQAGHWGVPGGKQEMYERAADAAARELYEEVRLTRSPGNLIYQSQGSLIYQLTVEDIVPAIGKHYVTRVYMTTLSGDGEAAENGEPEKHDIAWFPVRRLPDPLTDGFIAILEGLIDVGPNVATAVWQLANSYRRRKAHVLAPPVP